MNTNKSKWFDTIAIIFIAISFILITLFFSYCVAVTYDEYYYEYIERPNLIKKQQAEELNKKFETYKYIIDGREVNRDDIALELYNLVIDDDKEIIYMTGK